METRSTRKKTGGKGNRAGPHRSRREDRPSVDMDETGGVIPQTGNSTDNGREYDQNQKSSTPTPESVAGSSGSQPTEGENRQKGQRMKWTSQMNADLYRCYLQITEMETSNKPYSVLLYKAITEKHPQIRVKTVQNVLDQRRSLFTKNRLPPEVVQTIRREVEIELGMVADENEDENKQDDGNRSTQIHVEIDGDISQIFQRNLIAYGGLDPALRPRLPRLRFNKKTKRNTDEVNKVLQQQVDECKNLEELHQLIYAGAATVLESNEQKLRAQQGQSEKRDWRKIKPWETRISTKIENYRREIGVLSQMISTTEPSKRLTSKANYIMHKYLDPENINAREVLDLIKQRLAVNANRLRRYRESQKRRDQNKEFSINQKAFYRQLGSQADNSENIQTPLQKSNALNYWKSIWTKEGQHNPSAKWLQLERNRLEKIQYMTDYKIEVDELREATTKLSNWRAPGIDGVHNYWLKVFHTLHGKATEILNDIMQNPENAPRFFTQGITYLLPKTQPPSPDPAQYRPITCLPTIYKLFTCIITNKVYKHIEKNHIMATEQKGCQRKAYGCKELIVLDTLITEEAKRNKRDLYWGYIDYKKAYDNIPHSYLKEILKIYKITPQLTSALTTLMETWQTQLYIDGNCAGSVPVRRGIYQGDSLSPLWFCLALNPLSTMLNKRNKGYEIGDSGQKISHLIYMDDIKVLGSTKEEIRHLLQQVETFTQDTSMEFGLQKCRVNGLYKGKWQKQEGHTIAIDAEDPKVIEAMDREETYKYLGVLQAKGIEHKKIKEQLTHKYRQRLNQLLKTKLSAKNLVTAVNAYAVPVISYSFGIIGWTPTDLEDLNRLTRKIFTKFRGHHPHSSKERFHLPRSVGGRGVADMRRMHFRLVNGMKDYFYSKMTADPLYGAMVHNDRKYTILNLRDRRQAGSNITTENMIQQWRAKELHGRHANNLNQDHMDPRASNGWLRHGGLFPETEGFLISIQDHVVPTLNYRRYITKDPAVRDDRCRLCKSKPETIEHLTNSCQIMAAREYTYRHNSVAKILHNWIAYKIGHVQNRTPYYSYQPEHVCETATALLYWDRTIQTDHLVSHNRPDIVVLNKTTKKCTIIDIAIPAAANIKEKHKEKISKYLPLAAEIRQIWDVSSVEIVPIVLGSLGEVPKSLHEGIASIDLPPNLYLEMQKAVILATTNIIRKVLNNAPEVSP